MAAHGGLNWQSAATMELKNYHRLIVVQLIPALVAVIAVVPFLPALSNELVNWDDFDTLIVNTRYQGLGWTQLGWMFTTFHLGHYQPLSWLTWSLDYLLWGTEPFGFHLTNLLIHAANAALFYFLGRRLLESAAPESKQEHPLRIAVAAAFAALVFAAHPLRVESVAWATERRDVLSAHFLLWTVICYCRAKTIEKTRRGERLWMIGSLAFYLLSLLSKATGITLPVLLCILDAYPLKRFWAASEKGSGLRAWKLLVEKIPFVIMAVTFGVLAILAQDYAGALSRLESYPLSHRTAQAFYGIVFYLWKTLWPTGLSPLYQLYSKPTLFDPLDRPFVIAASLVLVITVALFIWRRHWPGALAAWACYILVLSPVLGLAQSGPQFVADRYSYLSCSSWALLAGAGLLHLFRVHSIASNRRGRWMFAAGCGGVIVLALGLLTWKQTRVWRTSETLWRHAIAINPESSRARFYLGIVLKGNNRVPEAVEEYRRALQIDPDLTDVYHHLAQSLGALGELDQAIENLRRYIAKAPPSTIAHIDLGIFLGRQGKSDEEMAEYRRALEIDPKSAEAHYGLGTASSARGELDKARGYFARAIELNPKKSEYYFSLGNLLVKLNLLDEATESFRQAVRVNPDFPLARNNLGRLLAARGDLTGAMEQFREALRVDPAFAPAHESMAQLLAQLGRRAEAMEHYREAVRLMSGGGDPQPPR